jgi:hypothetical protein
MDFLAWQYRFLLVFRIPVDVDPSIQHICYICYICCNCGDCIHGIDVTRHVEILQKFFFANQAALVMTPDSL